MKSITDFFKQDLRAPLKNQQWSWGAVDPRGRVFLRVWQKDWEHKARRVLAIAPGWENSLGHNERERQLALVEDGAPGYLVVCEQHANKAAGKPSIKDFRRDIVYPIELVERDGDRAFARWADQWQSALCKPRESN